MITDVFKDRLGNYIKESGGIGIASKSSTNDLFKIGVNADGLLRKGKMYVFNYKTPDEMFYDRLPIVLGLGFADDGVNQLGLNLHYLPFNVRLSLINNILKSFEYRINETINNKLLIGRPDRQPQLGAFSYLNLKYSFGDAYNLPHCVRQYRINRIRNLKTIGYEDWHIGVINDDDYFYGGSITDAQLKYYK